MKHNKQTDKYKYKSMTISVSWVGQWTIGQAVFYEEYVFVYINIIIIIFYIIWFSNSNMPWNWAVRWWGHKLQSHYYSASSPLIALQMCTYWRWWRRMMIMMTTIWMMMMMKCSVFMWIRNYPAIIIIDQLALIWGWRLATSLGVYYETKSGYCFHQWLDSKVSQKSVKQAVSTEWLRNWVLWVLILL